MARFVLRKMHYWFKVDLFIIRHQAGVGQRNFNRIESLSPYHDNEIRPFMLFPSD